jgi:arabinose-5-phosphate isomerase
MRLLHVFPAAELAQTAGGALEAMGKAFATIQRFRRRRRRQQDVDAPIVQFVDEFHETPRRIVTLLAEDGNIRENERMEATGQLGIVRLGARPLAQGLEVEPAHAFAAPPHRDIPAQHLDRSFGDGLVPGQASKGLTQLEIRGGIMGHEVGIRRQQGPQPVVGAAIEVEYVAVFLDQLDGGQEALPLQSVAVQVAGLGIGGENQHHTPFDQSVEKAREHHGVGDVCNEQFVEAQHRGIGREVARNQVEWIGSRTTRVQFAMYRQHEPVKMHAPLAGVGHGSVQEIHQESLATPDTAPEIDSAHRNGVGFSKAASKAGQPAARFAAARSEIVEQALQAIDTFELGIVRRISKCSDFGKIGPAQVDGPRLQRHGAAGGRLRPAPIPAAFGFKTVSPWIASGAHFIKKSGPLLYSGTTSRRTSCVFIQPLSALLMPNPDFQQSARDVLSVEAESIRAMAARIGPEFDHACRLLLECVGRVVVVGMGKSGHIGGKIAASLASTGTPAFFVHPGEASHGDLGMIIPNDVVIAISNSGETPEILTIIPLVKRMGVKLLAMTGRCESTLGRTADVCLDVGVAQEACPHNLAPTASTTTTLAMGDALTVATLKARGFTLDDFARSHPGGALGRRLLLYVGDIMHTGQRIPLVGEQAGLRDALIEMSSKGLGMTGIVDGANRLLGIFTDGDLRRTLGGQADVYDCRIRDVMTRNPKTTREDILAAELIKVMQTHSINGIFAVDDQNRVVGALNTLDLIRAGVL